MSLPHVGLAGVNVERDSCSQEPVDSCYLHTSTFPEDAKSSHKVFKEPLPFSAQSYSGFRVSSSVLTTAGSLGGM